MYKFAERLIDASSDAGFSKLDKVLSVDLPACKEKSISLKEELKDINILTAADMELLPDSDFALIHVDKEGKIVRRFPMPDLDNALISALYLNTSYKDMPAAAASIAADNLSKLISSSKFKYPTEIRWGINGFLSDIQSRASGDAHKGNIYREPKTSLDEELRKGQLDEVAKVKEARSKISDDDFVFISERDGKTHRLFPVDTKENLIKQADFFNKNHNEFHLQHRHEFAKKLRDKSAALKVKLSGDVISKYASYEWSPTVDCNITARISKLKELDLVRSEKTGEYSAHLKGGKEVVASLIGYTKLLNLVERTDIDKFASSLHKLDMACGMDRAYGKYISDPYSSTYRKTAAFNASDLASMSTMFAGKKITEKDIMALDMSAIGGFIDGLTFSELRADPIAVFNSLPIPYKSVIVEAIESKKKM
jgi:hypothetical protein